ncbi:hypothetical protein O3M35_005609 [Rhynocoris fuscipes]|uniref:Uncharacterized protein n=1 Tax=Rhynocoris fuscipes TaxID=488301 RepID=A0AAW1DL52_9HEMI
MGLPLVGGLPFFPHNYTSQDIAVSKQLIHYLANFARKGYVHEYFILLNIKLLFTFTYVFRILC